MHINKNHDIINPMKTTDIHQRTVTVPLSVSEEQRNLFIKVIKFYNKAWGDVVAVRTLTGTQRVTFVTNTSLLSTAKQGVVNHP